MHTMLALACLAFFAKKYVSTFSVHIKNTFDTMVSSSIYQDPRADISPPIMSRSRSEADRWKLVREVEQSFNAQSRQGGHYSDTTRPSWLLRRTRSSRIGEDDQSVLTANTCTTHSFKSKWQSSSASSKLGAVPKSQASFAVDSSFEATGLDVQSAAASRSHGLFYRQTSVRNKPLPVVQHPHEQQVGYCPTTVLGHSQSEVFPLPQALKQRKSSFFGRAGRHNSNHFPEYHPGVTRHSNIEIQVQPLPLLQSSASMGARLMVPDNLREDASIVSPPALVKRTSLLFTKLFPRRQKKLEQTPSSPQTLDSNGKKAESVGSYDYDEEVAMASSSSSSFDFRLPETLITNSPHRKKQHRSYADKSYIVGRDEHALLDRWSPSPVPPEPTSTPITKQTKSFTKAPKRPVRQDSVNKNIGQEEMEKQQQLLKSNLIQEKKDLLQQVRLVDSLLHEFSEHDDDDLDGESKEVDMVPHRMEDSTDDDSSNMSMLSGLMASWAADRDAAETPKPRLSVRFDRINIREYERIVGDNPSCTNGPPISIGWNFVSAHDYGIDEYETHKDAGRSKKDFHLSAGRRTDLLVQEWNCRPEDIRRARRDITYIQYCREKSAFAGKTSKSNEADFLRKANRKLQKNRPDLPDTQPPSALTRPIVAPPYHHTDIPPIQPPRQPSLGATLSESDVTAHGIFFKPPPKSGC